MAIKHEFYLNNELLDVDDSMSFQLAYQSTIFGDLSKLMSHGSTTLKFPMTSNNRRIINNINLPDIVTGFPYKEFTMDYYRNSVNIALDAIGYLYRVDEAYVELSMVWGIKTLLNPLSKNKLKDLPQMHVHWYNFMNEFENIGFPMMNWGLGLYVWNALPAVNISYLIDKISEQSGVQFDGLQHIKTELERLYLTTVDMSTDGALWEDNGNITKFKAQLFGAWESGGAKLYLTPEQYAIATMDIDDRTVIAREDGTMEFSTTYALEFKEEFLDVYQTDWGSYWMIIKKNGNEIFRKGADPHFYRYQDPDTKQWTYASFLHLSFNFIDEDAKMGDKYSFHAAPANDYNLSFIHNHTDYIIDYPANVPMIKLISRYNKLVSGMYGHPINSNLPDMTQLNFIQMIMWMYGLFPCYDYNKPNTISFLSVDDVVNNGETGNYYDFTGKLVNRNLKHEYRFGDYAQQNKLDYKKDDAVTTNASGIIYVDNENLNLEKSLLEMPVSATDMRNGYAFIQAFTPLENHQFGDTGDFKKPQPRILKCKQSGFNIYAVFDDSMKFGGDEGIIATKYKGYQDVVRTPHVIEAQYLLSEVDLIDFDIRKPIWDYTLGRMYAVISLTLQTNNVAKIEMIDISLIPMG